MGGGLVGLLGFEGDPPYGLVKHKIMMGKKTHTQKKTAAKMS